MKKILSKYVSIFMATLISLPFAIASEPAVSKEESSVSYNVGYMSDYWYRGV